MAKKVLQILALPLIVFCIPANCSAVVDFIKVIGFNSQSIARGGNSIAISDNPGDLNANPAIISGFNSNVVDFSLLTIFPVIEYTYSGTDSKTYTAENKNDVAILPGIHYAGKFLTNKTSVGLSLAVPNASGTEYLIQSKRFGPCDAFSEYAHMRFSSALSYDVSSSLSVGIRLGIDYMTMDVKMPIGIVYLDTGKCDGWGGSIGLGLVWNVSDNWDVGIYYESSTKMQDLKSKKKDGYVRLNVFGTETSVSNLDVTVEDIVSPQNFGIGVAYCPVPFIRLSSDVKYIDWNRNWDEVVIKFSGPDSSLLPVTALPLPLEIDNQVVFGLGIEYFMNKTITLAAGYHYNDDGFKDYYVNPLIPGETEHTFTTGISVFFNEKVRAGISLIYGIIDDPHVDGLHAYDETIETQLGMPEGSLDSELSGSRSDYKASAVHVSVSFFL